MDFLVVLVLSISTAVFPVNCADEFTILMMGFGLPMREEAFLLGCSDFNERVHALGWSNFSVNCLLVGSSRQALETAYSVNRVIGRLPYGYDDVHDNKPLLKMAPSGLYQMPESDRWNRFDMLTSDVHKASAIIDIVSFFNRTDIALALMPLAVPDGKYCLFEQRFRQVPYLRTVSVEYLNFSSVPSVDEHVRSIAGSGATTFYFECPHRQECVTFVERACAAGLCGSRYMWISDRSSAFLPLKSTPIGFFSITEAEFNNKLMANLSRRIAALDFGVEWAWRDDNVCSNDECINIAVISEAHFYDGVRILAAAALSLYMRGDDPTSPLLLDELRSVTEQGTHGTLGFDRFGDLRYPSYSLLVSTGSIHKIAIAEWSVATVATNEPRFRLLPPFSTSAQVEIPAHGEMQAVLKKSPIRVVVQLASNSSVNNHLLLSALVPACEKLNALLKISTLSCGPSPRLKHFNETTLFNSTECIPPELQAGPASAGFESQCEALPNSPSILLQPTSQQQQPQEIDEVVVIVCEEQCVTSSELTSVHLGGKSGRGLVNQLKMLIAATKQHCGSSSSIDVVSAKDRYTCLVEYVFSSFHDRVRLFHVEEDDFSALANLSTSPVDPCNIVLLAVDQVNVAERVLLHLSKSSSMFAVLAVHFRLHDLAQVLATNSDPAILPPIFGFYFGQHQEIPLQIQALDAILLAISSGFEHLSPDQVESYTNVGKSALCPMVPVFSADSVRSVLVAEFARLSFAVQEDDITFTMFAYNQFVPLRAKNETHQILMYIDGFEDSSSNNSNNSENSNYNSNQNLSSDVNQNSPLVAVLGSLVGVFVFLFIIMVAYSFVRPAPFIATEKFSGNRSSLMRPSLTAGRTVATESYEMSALDVSWFQETEEGNRPTDLVVGEPLGRGAYGFVYKATLNGETVAIKKVERQISWTLEQFDNAVQDFRAEALLCSKIPPHDNVLQFRGMIQTPFFCLITEFVDGGNLLEKLKQEPPSAVVTQFSRQLPIAQGVAKGLVHLHEHLLIHRDLAARNILLSGIDEGNTTAKISDFGLARFCSATGSTDKTNSTVGPVKHMAPEAMQDHVYSEKTDVWSFGILIFELITGGSEPYHDMSPIEVITSVTTSGAKQLAIPPKSKFSAMIRKCTEFDPVNRPTMRTCLQELEKL